MRDEKLLALKAFYLGRGITESPTKQQALDKVTCAIRKLEARNGPKDPLRRIFYLLLLAEIFRESGETKVYREAAKKEADDLLSEAFRYYMLVVEGTQTRKRVWGIGGEVYIRDQGIRNQRGRSIFDDWFNAVIRDEATAAVGLDERFLSKQDENFLYHMSLREIMRKHGLWDDCA
ncbi:MAG: hypothetical protein HY274_10710 [Gammaproteobacteria bacterium]|nr:hypothetical protein [Gammaproteobacteria bacterium]